MKGTPQLLSLDDVAEQLACTKRTVQRYIKAKVNRLPSVRINARRVFVRLADLNRWLEERTGVKRGFN